MSHRISKIQTKGIATILLLSFFFLYLRLLDYKILYVSSAIKGEIAVGEFYDSIFIVPCFYDSLRGEHIEKGKCTKKGRTI